VPELAKRVADLGWHLQFNIDGEVIVGNADDKQQDLPARRASQPG
jgi:hypothetical protein